jgi:hypothetical protein
MFTKNTDSVLAKSIASYCDCDRRLKQSGLNGKESGEEKGGVGERAGEEHENQQ